jgi:flagellum-specific peptidoglycan hydrolase FlgJ
MDDESSSRYRKVLLSLLIAFLSSLPFTTHEAPPKLDRPHREAPCPSNRKEAYIAKLYVYRDIYTQHGIDPIFGIAQAIVEQGWTIRDDYRVYNITWTKGCKQRYVTLDLKYRIYDSLPEAITDYCSTLQSKRYKHLLGLGWELQCQLIAESGYAEDKAYYHKLLPIARQVAQTLDKWE